MTKPPPAPWPLIREERKREVLVSGLIFYCHGWLSATLCLLSLRKKFSRCPDPVNAHLRPDCHFGSIPEKLSQQVASFVAKNPQDSLATEEEEWARKRTWEQLFRLACSDRVLVCVYPQVAVILYSGKLKLSRISWFCGYLWKFSLRNLGVWCPFAWHKRAIHEIFLRKNRLLHQFMKVFSLESFLLYSMSQSHIIAKINVIVLCTNWRLFCRVFWSHHTIHKCKFNSHVSAMLSVYCIFL